ncbi:IS3 family transposase [Sulfitobacter sp. 1151]|uniref:IS3 family transposase n=1 Tax=Parasulfitobacter algicola TaxID=2614809 RepID=A0ABX2IX00_9RHOB|nr:IS3 family transposase [Sulfitobacter algicola]NSX55705.1 IS3 family transposase [Sulfitobacter algicola]
MGKKNFGKRYPDELRACTVRMVLDRESEYRSRSAAISSVSQKVRYSRDSLRIWIRQHETDSGLRGGMITAEQDRIKKPERENRQLRQANEILKKASALFCSGGARPPVSEMIAFIQEHRGQHGVEPMCRVLQIAPSTFYEHQDIARDPSLASDRAKRDDELRPEVLRVWQENSSVYGARKLWHAMKQEQFDIARCTVERLMRDIGIEGVRRGKKVKTTYGQPAEVCPLDKVNRQFRALIPKQLWVSGFTFVSTWRGFVYVAFVVDTFANRIVGWKASTSQETQFLLDALEQALHARRPAENLIHHSDLGAQYVSVKYTERLVDAGLEPSVGSVGDSYDNALTETMIGLSKTEIINRLGPWKSKDQVEWETLKWVDWFNTKRIFEPLRYITPQEAENAYYEGLKTDDIAA